MLLVIVWNVRRECLSAAVGNEEEIISHWIDLLQNHDQIPPNVTLTHINADLFDCYVGVLMYQKR